MSNHSTNSNQTGVRRKSKTWKTDGNFEQSIEQSIHLRDLFGSQYTFEDDPSVHKRKSLESIASATTTPHTETATKKPESPQKQQQNLRHRKQQAAVTERIRRPIRTINSSGSQEGGAPPAAASSLAGGSPPTINKRPVQRSQSSVAAAASTTTSTETSSSASPPEARTSIEKSIHLRDIFGTQYTFDDDPSVHKRKSLESIDSTKESPKRISSTGNLAIAAAAAATSSWKPGSPQGNNRIRHRKQQPTTDRIKRPIRSNNSSHASQQSETTTANDNGAPSLPSSPTTGKSPIKRSKSNSTIHRNLSIDSTEGIPMMMKLGDSIQHHHDAGGMDVLSAAENSPDNNNNNNSNEENLDLVKAEEGNNHNSSQNNDDNNNSNLESQRSFFRDEPSSSSKEKDASYHSNKSSSPILLAQPLMATAKPARAATAYTTESKRRTCCCSCGIFLGLMTVFVLIQVFSILIWEPTPVLMSEEQAAAAAAGGGSQATLIQTPPKNQKDKDNPNQGEILDVPSSATTTTTGTGTPPEQNDLPVPPEQAFEAMEEGIMGNLLPASTLHAINDNDDAPQAMAFRWFHADPHWQQYSVERRVQRFVLATLYFATNPPYQHTWKNPGHWLSYDVNECEWSITKSKANLENDPRNLCKTSDGKKEDQKKKAGDGNDNGNGNDHDKSFVVTTLPLQGNNLQGQLPSEVSLLKRLTSVDLRRNTGLSGELPEEWCSVPNLQYDCAITTALTSSGVCGCGQCAC